MTAIDIRRSTAKPPPIPIRPPAAVGQATQYAAFQLIAWVIALFALLLPDNRISAVVLVAYLMLLPGDALRTALRVNVHDVWLRLIYAVATSLAVLMFGGLLLSGLAGLGFHPLRPWPVFILVSLVVAGCLVAIGYARSHPAGGLPDRTTLTWWGVGALLAVLAWSGAGLLDGGGGPGLTVVSLGVLGAGLVVAAVSRRAAPLRSSLLFFFTLALSWAYSQRTDYLFGFDVHQEYAWAQRTGEAGHWQLVLQDPYAAMLSITVLPVELTSVAGLPLIAFFKTIAPFAFALYITGGYLFLRRFSSDRAAFLTTLLLVMTPAAMWQLPAVSRQEVGLLEFVALLLLAVRAGGRSRGGTVLAVLLGAAMACSHYTTAYVALAVLLGGLVVGRLGRPVRRPWRSTPRVLAATVVLVALVSALAWNVGITQSSLNVGSAVTRTAEATGLSKNDDGLLATWLNGGVVVEVTPAEYFAKTELDAQQRPWLQGYGDGLQQRFVAQTGEIDLPDRLGPLSGLAPVTQVLYVALRQVTNLAMVVGVGWFAFQVLRRRRPSATLLDVLGMAGAALVLTMATRLNANLAQSYNAERLLLQTSLVLGIGVAMFAGPMARAIQARVSAWRPRLRVIAPAMAVLAALAVFDVSGLRNLLIINDAGHLVRDNEFYQRYGIDDADAAAADWLAQRYGRDDMVFADSYAALQLRGDPRITRGVFGELSPKTLDQRAYVYADSENVLNGRARTVRLDVRTAFHFPRQFFTDFKSRVYSNGSAEVYR